MKASVVLPPPADDVARSTPMLSDDELLLRKLAARVYAVAHLSALQPAPFVAPARSTRAAEAR